jgi:hypothetical protein
VPFAIAVLPFGTVMAKSNDARSLSESLTGIHPGVPCGSPTTNAPSSVGTHPSMASSGSTTGSGRPAYSTPTTNRVPRRSPRGGVMTSSCPLWLKVARRRFTVTFETS